MDYEEGLGTSLYCVACAVKFGLSERLCQAFFTVGGGTVAGPA